MFCADFFKFYNLLNRELTFSFENGLQISSTKLIGKNRKGVNKNGPPENKRFDLTLMKLFYLCTVTQSATMVHQHFHCELS